jgi:hypothetical protein
LAAEPKEQFVSENTMFAIKGASPKNHAGFDSTRQRVYTGLLLFIVIAGLLLVSIPSLRRRLASRTHELVAAISGETKPAGVQIGSNTGPHPELFKAPMPSVPHPFTLPQAPEAFNFGGSGNSAPAAPEAAGKPVLRHAPTHASPKKSDAAEYSENVDNTAPSAEESEVVYKHGQSEQEAYDLLLKKNPVLAGLVSGSNPSMKFKTWDAANRQDDVYWVRLKFNNEGAESEYIWQVKLQSQEVTPLSYNAKNIS